MCSSCTAGERATKGETCADQMTELFSGAQRCYAIIGPSACDAFRACEETVLRCTCSVYGCTVHLSRQLSGILSRKPKSPPFLG